MNAPTPLLLEALRGSPIGADLPDEDRAVLAGLMTLRSYGPQQLIGREGEADDRLFVVVEGALAVVKSAGTSGETLLTTLHSGDLAHELGFLDGSPRYASLVAAENSRVLEIRRADLESLIDSHPRILYAVMCAIVRAVHRVQTRLSIQATELTNYVYKQHGRY